jgi:ATP-dependent exoDNAse (exonuclease V) alpha subunit
MPAWAVTIHKAQGLTLARVAVDFGRGAFAEGQVYVALSRCQSLKGLSLARAMRPHEVRCSDAARSFYARIRRRRV